MTLTRAIIGSSVLALCATTAVSTAQSRPHERAYCESLAALAQDIHRFKSTGGTRLSDQRALLDEIDRDVRTVETHASKLKISTGQQFAISSRRVAEDAQSMPDDMMEDRARARLNQDLKSLRHSTYQLAAEVRCPADGSRAPSLDIGGMHSY